MKFLVVLALASILTTSSGYQRMWNTMSSMWYCNPPKTLRGVVKLVMFNNIRTDDDIIDGKDFYIDMMEYDYDGNPCRLERWEWVYYWKCVYGYTERYAGWFFDRFDPQRLGYYDLNKALGNNSFTIQEFKERQYDRLAVDYCNNTVNWQDSLCDRVKAESREMVLAD